MTPENAILTLLTAAAGSVPVIPSDQAESSPLPPYIAMTVRWVQSGPVEEGRVDDNGNLPVHDHRDATVELRSTGAAAYDVLDGLGLILRHPAYEEQAEALGLALFDTGSLQRVPRESAGAASGRLGVRELGFRYVQTHVDFVGVIETVTGTITTTGGLLPALETPFSAETVTAP
ncbi:phage neck terminator protein [Achromobacter marplatensis]|uniref:phage neck terminator protein n=1 Tax=Achromobacter marplatensis TaxID=470868 RepID=UPI0039F703FF